ncbi:hypothetical protein KC685_04910, partial [Candidatus Dojkabacteria bacterium]|nr:hypothetical protein [Candidatus Dojkabacteria bacterium]
MGGYYIGNSQVGTSDDGSSSTLTGDEISINAEIFKRWFEAAEKDQLEGEKNEENTTDVGQEKGEEQGSDTTPPNPTPQPPPDPQPTSPPATTNNWWSYPSVINTIPASSVTLTTV